MIARQGWWEEEGQNDAEGKAHAPWWPNHLQTCLVLSVLLLLRPKHCSTCCRKRAVVPLRLVYFFFFNSLTLPKFQLVVGVC